MTRAADIADIDVVLAYAASSFRRHPEEVGRRVGEALKLDPDNPRLLAYAGACAYLTGRNDLAWRIFSTLVLADPTDRHAVEYLALIAERTGKAEAAQRYRACAERLEGLEAPRRPKAPPSPPKEQAPRMVISRRWVPPLHRSPVRIVLLLVWCGVMGWIVMDFLAHGMG